ncbi:MAG: hypothetical protein ACOCV4_03255 [Myxococcota bacterium]
MNRLSLILALVAVGLSGAAGCARGVKVARPTEGVDYVVVRVPGMVPQARLERCTEQGCDEVYDVKTRPAEEVP